MLKSVGFFRQKTQVKSASEQGLVLIGVHGSSIGSSLLQEFEVVTAARNGGSLCCRRCWNELPVRSVLWPPLSF